MGLKPVNLVRNFYVSNFNIHARGNKSAAAKFRPKTGKFGAFGCLTSVAAKLVKTAAKIIILIHARGNKSAAAKFGPKTGKFGAKLLRLKFQDTCAWKKISGGKIWA